MFILARFPGLCTWCSYAPIMGSAGGNMAKSNETIRTPQPIGCIDKYLLVFALFTDII